MNIALIGYGKMGKEVERIAIERGMIVKKVFTSSNNIEGLGLTKQALKDVDICIDFSNPRVVIDNIEAVAEAGKNIVVGTTGWYDKLKEVERLIKAKKIGLLYSPNFSLGMNIFCQILTSAVRYFNKSDLYDVAIHEMHHRGKADSPSGTALALGQIILQHLHSKKEMLHETAHKQRKPEELHVTSTRVGYVAGIHRILFDSEADSIELTHTAKNRNGFALGALIAAGWLRGKKGMFTMKDVLMSS
ncbi:MAG: 4-hydroxy-tetrahydrodipicolinate reductase [Ignavibacteriae bacterium]|nr:4-hydroxy-tetrahydrodipicolinate reductase [Ignavibacteriota bacterium]